MTCDRRSARRRSGSGPARRWSAASRRAAAPWPWPRRRPGRRPRSRLSRSPCGPPTILAASRPVPSPPAPARDPPPPGTGCPDTQEHAARFLAPAEAGHGQGPVQPRLRERATRRPARPGSRTRAALPRNGRRDRPRPPRELRRRGVVLSGSQPFRQQVRRRRDLAVGRAQVPALARHRLLHVVLLRGRATTAPSPAAYGGFTTTVPNRRGRPPGACPARGERGGHADAQRHRPGYR